MLVHVSTALSLSADFDTKFCGFFLLEMDKGEEKSGIVRLSDIRQLMAQVNKKRTNV